jgi:hypothetical protein
MAEAANEKGDDEDRAAYSEMSDDEFLDELRSHQSNDSWTLGHWLERERRGEHFLDSDPGLEAAMRAQSDRVFSAIGEALAPVREQMAAQFKALMPDLSSLMPDVDYSQFFPQYNLDLPRFELHDLVAADLPSFRPDSIFDSEDTIASLAEIQEERWEREEEVRQAQLDTARAAAGQVELLRTIEEANQERHRQLVAGYEKVADEVRSGHQPRWTVWAMLVLTAIAAVASVLAVVISLG